MSEPKRGNVFTSLASFFGLHKPHVALTVAITLLLVITGVLNYAFFLKSRIQLREQQFFATQDTLANQQKELGVLQTKLEQDEGFLKILLSAKAQTAVMRGDKTNPMAFGKIVWDGQTNNAVLQVSRLPALPHDKEYQLWITQNKQTASAGLFSIAESEKEKFLRLEHVAITEGESAPIFSVTLEPKGGVAQPAGMVVLSVGAAK